MASLEGVYRYRRLIDGRRAWYALTEAGEIIAPGLRVVGATETEAQVVAELREVMIAARRAQHMRVVRGEDEHTLTPRPAAASLSVGAFVMLLRDVRARQPA